MAEGSAVRDASPVGVIGPGDLLAVVAKDAGEPEAVRHRHFGSVRRDNTPRGTPATSVLVLASGRKAGGGLRVLGRLEDVEPWVTCRVRTGPCDEVARACVGLGALFVVLDALGVTGQTVQPFGRADARPVLYHPIACVVAIARLLTIFDADILAQRRPPRCRLPCATSGSAPRVALGSLVDDGVRGAE